MTAHRNLSTISSVRYPMNKGLYARWVVEKERLLIDCRLSQAEDISAKEQGKDA